MKRILLLVPILALLMLLLASPVIAAPAQKFSVSLETKGSTITAAESRITNGDIVHTVGGVRGGPVYLTIGSDPVITGTYIETGDSVINTKTGESIVHFNTMVCDFPGGSFEGIKTMKSTYRLINGAMTAVEQSQHAVLHGSGIYEGQTLKIGYDWVLTSPPVPKIYDGILIVP